MQHLALLTALFESVLVFDENGRVLQRHGAHVDIDNLLTDERLSPIRDRLIDCISGVGFETYFASGNQERTRWRGVPYATEDGQKAVALAIEGAYQGHRARASGAEFDFVLANMRQGFWRRNAKGVIIHANEYLGAFLQYSAEDMVGRHVSEFVPNHVDQDGQYEAEFVTSQGIRKKVIVASSPLIGPKGRLTGYIDVVTDVTVDRALRARLLADYQKMSILARTDNLTGLANRMEFQEELSVLQQLEQQEPFGLVMVDLDRFKDVNDKFGHPAGDIVLMEFALRLKQAVRDSDLVARLGGDEFALLLVGASKEVAAEIVERLTERLRFTIAVDEEVVPVRASIGWAHSDDGRDLVLKSADRQMYSDKRTRKGA